MGKKKKKDRKNEQRKTEIERGQYVEGNVTPGSDFVGRDKHQHTHYHGTAALGGTRALHQLPSAPADFTGRMAELARLRQMASGGSAVISGLRGLGGVGKTALALVLAHELKASYPGGQFYINLRGASENPVTAQEALEHVIRGCDPTAKLPEHLGQLEAIYRAKLDGQRALILLDDAHGAGQITPLVPPEGCLLLVTTRQRFTLPGMQSLDLQALPEGEAVQLLQTIAERIDAESAAEIAQLCGRLPLALRLAGSLLAEYDDLAVGDYLAQLGDESKRVAALDEAEQLTGIPGVRASLELSLARLEGETAGRWAALGVFPGDFDGDAAAAVWGALPKKSSLLQNMAARLRALAGRDEPEDAPLDLEATKQTLQTLRNYSLIEWDGEAKRYYLHDLARDLAAAKVAPPALTHARYYLRVLRRANDLYEQGGEQISKGLALFDRERANIEAGQAWVAGQAEEDEAVANLADSYADNWYILNLRLHPRELIAWLEVALAAARRLGRKSTEGVHLGNLGLAYADLGEVGRAIEYYEQALEILREIGDRRSEGQDLGNLGLAYAGLGEVRRAIEYHKQALTISREIGDRRGEGQDLGNLGNAYADLGEVRRAIAYHEQALEIAREIGDRSSEGVWLGNLGLAYADLGEVRRAIEYHEQALEIAQEIGDRSGEGIDLGNLGWSYAELGEADRALEYCQQALAIAREIGHRYGESNTLAYLGRAYQEKGEFAAAVEYCEQGLAVLREIGDRYSETEALNILAGVHLAAGDAGQAAEASEQALGLARAGEYRREEGIALWGLARAQAALGQPGAAANAEAALAIFEAVEHPDAEAVRSWLAEQPR